MADMDFIPKPNPPYPWWVNPTTPTSFSNAMSQLELIRNVVNNMTTLYQNQNGMAQHMQLTDNQIAELQRIVTELQATLDGIANGDNIDFYLNMLSSWIDQNLIMLVGRIVKYVMFGITDDGYFCAYIPDSWDFISWDTVMDYKSDLYGHLLMRW